MPTPNCFVRVGESCLGRDLVSSVAYYHHACKLFLGMQTVQRTSRTMPRLMKILKMPC